MSDPYTDLKASLRKPVDEGGYDGFHVDPLHTRAAQVIDDLQVALASQIEITNTERTEKERLLDLSTARPEELQNAAGRSAPDAISGKSEQSGGQASSSGADSFPAAPAAPEALLKEPGPLPPGCYCEPGRCMAPLIMGVQQPCRDPAKASQSMNLDSK